MAETREHDPRRQAVAIQHDAAKDPAPRITATGFGTTAERIVQLALDHGVKVREDADLAEVLAVLDLDSLVPLDALRTVAEILAHVYRANGDHDAHREELERMEALASNPQLLPDLD